MSERIFNFSAGPATLPTPVLEEARDDLLSYKGCGMSVMEMSHRSKEFTEIIEQTKASVKSLLSVPDSHEVLFLQGGASLQFVMAPQNLCLPGKPVDMINTGSWTKKALKEIKTIGEARIAATTEEDNFLRLPKVDELNLSADASYVHCASNNTIFGTQWKMFPKTGDVPLVADMSSDILSRPIDVSDFGLIFAGAQKNIGPAGVTLVIVDRELAERAPESLPTMHQYRTFIEANSLYNTPPCFAIYISGLVMKWIESMGGLQAMDEHNKAKAEILYQAIDDSDFFYCPVKEKQDRSMMNAVFRITGDNAELEKKFVSEATANGLSGLKGHRSVGGLRASIYNAMPKEGIEALVAFMKEFEAANG